MFIINSILNKIQSLQFFFNNKQIKIDKFDPNFNLIIENFKKIFVLGRIMPAFGVSLHDETLSALKQDNWVRLNFDGTQTINELPFEALLFKLEDCYGFNLIRENNGRYEGRCIYLSFDNLINFEEILKNFN